MSTEPSTPTPPCPSGDTNCTVDRGRCKGGLRWRDAPHDGRPSHAEVEESHARWRAEYREDFR